MKLKNMCSVLRRPLAGDSLKSEEVKAKKSEKSNKKNTFKPKWQKPSKGSDESPPKSLLIEDALSPTKQVDKSPKRNSPPPIADRRKSPDLPSPLKPNATKPLLTTPGAESRLSPDVFESKSAYSNPAASFANENGDFSISRQYDQVASDEELSQSRESFARNWPTRFSESSDKNGGLYIPEVAQTFKSSSFEDRCEFHHPRPTSNHSDSNFEDLQNEMMKKYGFVGLNGAVSFDVTKTEPLHTSLNNLAVVSRPQRPQTHTGDEQTANLSVRGASTKRAASLNQPHKPLDRSDIPPIIPPREPVRSSRISPPLRSCSTPSPTSSLLHHHSTATTTHFSPSISENSRSKYQFQPSTTAVFSALPSGLSNSNPIILPIMKDGQQESHTHYFLLGDDKAAAKHLKPTQPAKAESFNGVARPTPSVFVAPFNRFSCPPPQRPPPPSNTRFNSLQNFASASNKNPNLLSTYPPRRTSTTSNNSSEERSQTRYNDMGRGQKVVLLQSEVFGVTDEECQQALRTHNWDVSKSIKYLKVEQLFQMGAVSSKEECERTLRNAEWNLESASRNLLERHNRSQHS